MAYMRFVLPMGVFHHIKAHGSSPPPEFFKAIEPLAVELEVLRELPLRVEMPPATH